MDCKQAILIRDDLKLPKGKLAAQACHASVESALNANKRMLSEWRLSGQKKIVLKVKDEEELIQYFQEAKDSDLSCSLITDAGLTVIAPGTKTAVGIGPDEESKIDALVGKLKLL